MYFPQTTHIADVLVVMHTDNDRTRTEEQQRLEKSVRHQVEDRNRVSSHAKSNRHVTQLRER